ncbi:MAG: phospholipase D-like domain-containing protein, partial [Chloroflexota bacterium]|nr:phospholipase D-like domain-containing protein [Chloroflexota bacterium]
MAHFGVTQSARLLTLAGVLLGLLLACGPNQQPAIQDPARLIVMPDDGSMELPALLRRAEHSIDVMVYLLTSQEVVRELAAAQRRGVRVRVLLEENPVGGGEGNRNAAQELAAAGVAVRWSAPTFRFTHAKMILVDGVRAAIMTLNLTASSMRSNREFVVIVEDSSVLRALSELF